MAIRRCQNRSNDIIRGGRWWWWWWYTDNGDESYFVIIFTENLCRASNTRRCFLQSFDVIMAVSFRIMVLSSVTPYILVGECHRFGEPYCLHVQGWKVSYKLAASYIAAARIAQTLSRLVRVRTVPVGSRFSTLSRPAPKTYPFCTMGTGSFFHGEKRSGRVTDHTTPF
jgi:hypothetical protein